MTVSLSIMIEKSTRWMQVEPFFPTRLVRHTSEDQREITQINNRNLPGCVLPFQQPTTALNAPQLHTMLGCFKLQRRFLSAESKWREEVGLQQYTKSPLLYFLSSHFFFFNDGNWSPVFVQQKNSFKWLKTQKMQTYQIKSKTILESIVLPFCFMPPPPRRPRFVLNSVFLAQRRVSPVQPSVLGFSSTVSVWMEVGSWSLVWFWSGAMRSGSDAGELVPEAGRQDALHLLHDEVQRSKQRAEELQGDKETNLNMFDFGPSASWMLN